MVESKDEGAGGVGWGCRLDAALGTGRTLETLALGGRPTRFILMHSPVLSPHSAHNSLFHSAIVSVIRRVVSLQSDTTTTALLYDEPPDNS